MTAMKILWEVSIQSAFMIAVILLLRVILKNKISPAAQYALWLLPLVRLIFPFSVSSNFSIMNVFEPATRQFEHTIPNTIQPAASSSPQALIDPIVNPSVNQVATPVQHSVSDFNTMILLFWIWLAGIAVVAIYSIYVNCHFNAVNKRSRLAIEIPDDIKELLAGMKRPPAVYTSKAVSSPCLCGLFKPYILLSEKSADTIEKLEMVLAHELSHYRQKDHIFALLRCALCAVYWFNPFIWLAASKSRQDCELACDARVIKGYSKQQRERYGLALIGIIESRPAFNTLLTNATSMTAGKKEIKRRIIQIANRPKMLKITMLGLALIMVAISIVACTSAADKNSNMGEQNETPAASSPPVVSPSATPAISENAVPSSSDSELESDRTDPQKTAVEFLTRYFDSANNGGLLLQEYNNGLFEPTQSIVTSMKWLDWITLINYFLDYDIAGDVGYYSSMQDVDISNDGNITVVKGYFRTTAYGTFFEIKMQKNAAGNYMVMALDFPDNQDYINFVNAFKKSTGKLDVQKSPYIDEQYDRILKECIAQKKMTDEQIAVAVAKWHVKAHTAWGLPYNINNPSVKYVESAGDMSRYDLSDLSREAPGKTTGALWQIAFDADSRKNCPIYYVDAKTFSVTWASLPKAPGNAGEEFAQRIEFENADNLYELSDELIQKYGLTTRRMALMGFDGNTVTLDEIEDNWPDGVDKQVEPYLNAVEKEEVFEFAPDDKGFYPAYMWYAYVFRDTDDSLGQMTAQDLTDHARDAVDYFDVYTCYFDNGNLVLMVEDYMQ